MKKTFLCMLTAGMLGMLLMGCEETKTEEPVNTSVVSAEVTAEPTKEATTEPTEEPKEEEQIVISLSENFKMRGNTNPVMTQSFGADPYAMEYNGTLYIYMTADAFEYELNKDIKDNSYSKIKTIHVISTTDMKNFTDYGEINVAGSKGAATWANNSWAPAACWKNIDGQDKFFLYFADNGGGIGVLVADSPTGPFTDPLGHALISRKTPECADVLWLFDPAVLVDDDGTGYLYFGGGVPEGQAEKPGTGRCVQLGDDMISIVGTPVRMDIPYLFEDSGIHKYNNKYYYTYCSNWSVDENGTAKYGLTNAQICIMESDSPLGPFTYSGVILDNPGTLCGLWGNNHHCVFSFLGEWYITYHSRQLEKSMGIEKGYRITFIDKISFDENGNMKKIKQTLEGPAQLKNLDPYTETSSVCVSSMAGCKVYGADDFSQKYGYGHMTLSRIETGDYTEVTGVDFGDESPKTVSVTVRVPNGCSGKIHIRADYPTREDIATVKLSETDKDFVTFTAEVKTEITGVHYLYFVFEGENYFVDSWKFEK